MAGDPSEAVTQETSSCNNMLLLTEPTLHQYNIFALHPLPPYTRAQQPANKDSSLLMVALFITDM